jgi:hypothetical protein
MSDVNLDAVERTMLVLAERIAMPFVYHDPADGMCRTLTPAAVAARAGFLPAIVGAGEAIWRQASGRGFELDIVRDPDALLGYQLRGIRAGSFSTVMLSAMEALQQVAYPDAILLDELNAVWASAATRTRSQPITAVAVQTGLRP